MVQSKLKNKQKTVKKQAHFKTLFPTFISSISHHKKILRAAGKYTFYIAIGLFLFLNIFLSRFVSPIYFQMMNDNQKATVSYLQSILVKSGSIRSLPQFSTELLRQKNIYGNELENEIYDKEIKQNAMIQNYELLLRKNLLSRDILYSLFLLYDQKGDKKMAQKYLEQSRTVDPLIKQ